MNVRSAAEACKAAPAEDPAARGYALLAEGKREEAVRALHDAVRPTGTLPVGAKWILGGFPPGYHEATPGPQGMEAYALVSGGIGEPSFLFDRGVLVRRFRGRAFFLPKTSLIRVEHGPGIEVIRAATGEVVFEAVSVDAIAERSGGLAVLHTDCAGQQKLDVVSGDAPRRMPTFGTNAADKIGWVGDDYVWLRREDEKESRLVAIATGKPDPGEHWGAFAPELDVKGRFMVVHDDPDDHGLTTTLIDWKTRRVLHRAKAGVHTPTSSSLWVVFNDEADAFAIGNFPCEALLFRTNDLSVRHFETRCGGEEGVTGLVDLRFWPRNDTLFVLESLEVAVHDVATGNVLAEAPLSFSYATSHFEKDDAAFLIDDCDPARGKRIQIRIDRSLKVTRREHSGKCIERHETSGNEALFATLAAKMCNVETFPDALPREVCRALRVGKSP